MGGKSPHRVAWSAVAVIAAGAGLYLWCLWVFATVGRATPGPWDAPRRVVAVGPYRWVRNPINIAPLLIVIAGLGNINGVIYASLILGLSEAFVEFYVPQGGGWAEGVFFVLILGVLLVRPRGLFR